MADPFGGPSRGYTETAALLDNLVGRLVDLLCPDQSDAGLWDPARSQRDRSPGAHFADVGKGDAPGTDLGIGSHWVHFRQLRPSARHSPMRLISGHSMEEESRHRVGQRIVVGVPAASDRGDGTGLGQTLGVANGQVLTGLNRSKQYRLVESTLGVR